MKLTGYCYQSVNVIIFVSDHIKRLLLHKVNVFFPHNNPVQFLADFTDVKVEKQFLLFRLYSSGWWHETDVGRECKERWCDNNDLLDGDDHPVHLSRSEDDKSATWHRRL
jgi:hypothetical protein